MKGQTDWHFMSRQRNFKWNDPRAERHATIAALRRYWESLRRDGDVPARASFDPFDIPQLIPHLVFLERRGAGDYLFRVAGGHIVRIDGNELTGKRLDRAEFGDAYDEFTAIYEACVADRAPKYFSGNLFWQQRSHADFIEGLFPLTGRDGEIGFLLGCVVFLQWHRA